MDVTQSSMLIFDMDGVLVDVSESYRAAIAATVEQFTKTTPSAELIQRYKNDGGWNNDWELSHRLIFDLAQRDVPYPEVVSVFQSHFLGRDHDGLVLRERWLPSPGLLERLAQRHSLALFTGRPCAEVEFTLDRFAPEIRWKDIVADGDVAAAKPAPEGLLAIKSRHADAALNYIGDTVDDARSASAAGVRFIGVADRRHDGLEEILRKEGADAVIENVNELEQSL